MNKMMESRARQVGLTRIDVLTTAAVLVCLAMLNLASVSHNRAGSEGATCLANVRDLTRAWQQFSLDQGHFPPNPDDGGSTPGSSWVVGQVGPGGSQQFNPDILTNAAASLLYPYLTFQDASVFRCPAELAYGRYQGSDPRKRNTVVPSARSYAMNLAVGTDPSSPEGLLPVDGFWLDNQHSHTRGRTWRTYGNFDAVVDPTPAGLAVLIEEDTYSINDGVVAFGMARAEWIDWPSTRHRMGGTLSYADGHVQLRRWRDPRTAVQGGNVARRSVPDSPDYAWLRQRISAPLRPQ